MPTIPLFQVDAFASRLFEGNPAAVCPLESWLTDETMQAIAAENNLAETAFIVAEPSGFRIRWFTPTVEVDLCGHATLAAGHIVLTELGTAQEVVSFESRSGPLMVRQSGEDLSLDLPVDDIQVSPIAAEIIESIGIEPKEMYKGRSDVMLVYENQQVIERIAPDFRKMIRVPARGVIVTAPGDEVDFVSRFFAPMSGIDEDPVTGSAHTSLTPYWAERLDKQILVARQLSLRGGSLRCRLDGERVHLTGRAKTFLKGTAMLPD
jgi:PhzF family phenazine biosynthesis protein